MAGAPYGFGVLRRIATVGGKDLSKGHECRTKHKAPSLCPEGTPQFVASYKFALLMAIADLAVIKGNDSGSPLPLSAKEIAEKFIELSWQQCRPFELGGQSTGLILQQNTGKQAAVIGSITTAQEECGGSLFRLRQTIPGLWTSLVTDLRRQIEVDHFVPWSRYGKPSNRVW